MYSQIIKYTFFWEQRKLKDLVQSVGTGKSKYTISNYDKYPILGSRNIIGYDTSYDYSGDFILTARVGEYAGELYRYRGKVKITDNTVYLQGDNLDYLFYLLKKFNLKKLSFGSGQPLVKASELSNLNLIVSNNKKESKAIANLMTNLDNLITLHQRKYDKLVNVKQSLLEKMFPKNYSNIPEIRFKGFTDVWEQRKLGELYNFRYGDGNHNPSNGGKYDVYGANGIIGGYDKFNSEDSIIIGHMGEYAGSVLWAEGKHFVTYNGTITRPKRNNIDDKFGYYMLYRKELNKICGGSGLPFLSYQELNKVEVNYSKNKDEQIKISKLLTDLDNLITLHQRKLDKLKNIKQSLLDKMFV